MTCCKTHGQRGVALIMALMLLMLLTALAAALVYVANMETAVNGNYRRGQVLYFAAKAGIEEARDRMLWTNPSTLFAAPLGTCAGANCMTAVPQTPTGANGQVFYLLGGATPAAVTPWAASNVYTDDDLCHYGYNLAGQTTVGYDSRCDSGLMPTGPAWYTTGTSNIPWAGTSAAPPYQWVRISWKLNDSQGIAREVCPPANAWCAGYIDTTPVCWNGISEVPLDPRTADCTQMASLLPHRLFVLPNGTTEDQDAPATPVYVVTSLAMDTRSGARRMIQAELAAPPSAGFTYGLFANSPVCGSLSLSGGATSVGTVGSNGNVNISGSGPHPTSQTGGNIYVPITGAPGTCSGSSGPPYLTIGGSPIRQPEATLATYSPPVPVVPNTPTSTYTPPKPQGCATAGCMVPGTYGQISGTTLTLAPGVYNIDSLSISANGSIIVSPNADGSRGAVILNVAGLMPDGITPLPTVVSITSHDAVNVGNGASNFQINYGCVPLAGGTPCGIIDVHGGSNIEAVIDAPYAQVNLSGTGGTPLTFKGAVIGGTISLTGAANFTYDPTTATPKLSKANDVIISMRDLAY